MNTKCTSKMANAFLVTCALLLNPVSVVAACPFNFVGTNGNDMLSFQGASQPFSATLVNPYSGEEITIIEDSFHVNNACYDGQGGDRDVLRMSNASDVLLLDDFGGVQTVSNTEIFVAGGGNDIIILATSNFEIGKIHLEGGAGDDMLWANAGADTINGNSGNDTINGGPGNDHMDSGIRGDDILTGWTGDDTYFYGNYPGLDTIRDGGGGFDTLEFNSDVLPADVVPFLMVSGDDLVVPNSNTPGSFITIENQFGADGLDRVERLLFSDGTTIDLTTIAAGAFVLKQEFATGQPGFGVPVALDGNTALVGAPGGAGSASLLDTVNGQPLQTFDNPNPGTSGPATTDFYATYFQKTVALSGGRVLIGAESEDVAAVDSGAAYLFDANTGSLLQTFTHPNPIPDFSGPGFGQGFGREVALDGDKVLVASIAREAFLFDAVSGGLLQTFSDSPGLFGFGESVALSEQYVAIGDKTNNGSEGAVHLFDTDTGAFLHTIFNPTPDWGEFFGEEIALDGNRVLIGAGQVDVDGVSNAGEAYLYDAVNGQLLHTFVDPTGHSNAFFGRHLDIEGDVIAIGVQGDSEVHIFDAISGGIVQTISEPSAFASFGRSVDLDQGNLLVGMPFGKAYFYGRDQNQAPTSNAGPDQLVHINSTVVLDGTGSTDPESDPLYYSWTIGSTPAGSSVVLVGADTQSPSFEPDLEGLYEVELIVSDVFGSGVADSVEILVISAEQFAENEIASSSEVIDVLESGQITTQGNQNALMNFLAQATIAIQEGDLAEAINKLQKAMLRTDGCVLRGAPDVNGVQRDWIIDCAEQAVVYASLNSALEALSP